ncbi:MAG TPA: UDP-N-acetylmuramoyl-L-alanyl-D-glutamate--2,6-diaminopimelate ligase, partial [Chromatiales bacterium]|nr:UDP-N-acetylmuramoyl-L-alanyl-D-glutamate--2,6-diaminopimelate ligase [Chromatiales bacterium]
ADVAGIEVPGLRSKLGLVADRFFGRPSDSLTVIGVTGSNGKTTVAWLLAQALNAAGRRAGYIGTLGHGLLSQLQPGQLTTPDCIEVHRQLRRLHEAGADHAVIEVSSHALDQGRVDAVRFDVAAFTNLSRDHLDYHRDATHYAAAKARLFTEHHPAAAVINVADAFGAQLVHNLPPDTRPVTVTLTEDAQAPVDASLSGRLGCARCTGLQLELTAGDARSELGSALWGRFNAENLLIAAGVLIALGHALDRAATWLAAAEAPPGRMQRVNDSTDEPAVLIDFAHSPDALRNALEALREHCGGEIWCVFGCGGNRDRGKRAQMAAVAERYADHVIVTDDNPRDEDPEQIVAEILAGFAEPGNVEVQHDRAVAIRLAIRSAQAGDAVLIAGKGHETTQTVGSAHRAFSDLAVARAALDQVA